MKYSRKNSLFRIEWGIPEFTIIIITACIKRGKEREGKLVNPFLWWWLYCAASKQAKQPRVTRLNGDKELPDGPLSFINIYIAGGERALISWWKRGVSYPLSPPHLISRSMFYIKVQWIPDMLSVVDQRAGRDVRRRAMRAHSNSWTVLLIGRCSFMCLSLIYITIQKKGAMMANVWPSPWQDYSFQDDENGIFILFIE